MTAQYVEEFSDSGEPRPAPPRVGDVAHPAATYFSKRFRELTDSVHLREVDSDGVHKLSAPILHALLEEQAPELAVSARQIYRYYSGEATPRIDFVFEVARLFGVSPRVFLPPSTENTSDDGDDSTTTTGTGE